MYKCKLSECVKEINNRTTENNQYEVLTSSKNGIFSQEEYFDKQVASKDNTGYKIIKKGQFTYRSMSDSGTFTINRLENKDIGIVSPAYPVFEATNIDAEFLKYYFKSELFNRAIINLSQGSTRTALKFKDLIDIEIYLPEIEKQKKIVKILKNNDQIIEKYDKLIKEKEQFTKSQFVEMFCNKDFKTIKLEEIADIYDGTHHTPKYLSKGIKFVSVENIDNIYFTDKYISDDAYKNFKVKPEINDIFMTRIGTIGKCAIITKKEQLAYYVSLALLKIHSCKIISIYLKYLLESDFGIDELNKKTLTYATPIKINKNDIGKINIILAPIELQNKFAQIIKLIDKQKFELERQKQNYIELKKGLMQQLLTGKLIIS